MTVKIRSLVVSGACLLGIACSDSTPSAASDTRKQETKSAPAMAAAKTSFESDKLSALTTSAPAQPSTILDGPAQKKPVPIAAAPTASASELRQKSDLLRMTGHDEPLDYNRPLKADEVQVERFVLATGVVGREPVGESEVFTTDTKKIFAFIELANPDAEPYAIRVHWEPLEGPASPYGVELHVKTAARFRTWSWTAIPREPGKYRALLRTLDGEEIASRELTIVQAAMTQ